MYDGDVSEINELALDDLSLSGDVLLDPEDDTDGADYDSFDDQDNI